MVQNEFSHSLRCQLTRPSRPVAWRRRGWSLSLNAGRNKMSLISKFFGRSIGREKANTPAAIDLSTAVAKSFLERRAAVFPRLQPGFTFEGTGRCGYIYFKEDRHMLEVYWEMSGVPQYDFLLSREGLGEWCYPEVAKVTSIRQTEILADLRAWLRERKMRTDL
jgi:hypothetical protein